jgi:acetylornithine deacetylase/succinyl-diaminopimelate desuccinylase-like protein
MDGSELLAAARARAGLYVGWLSTACSIPSLAEEPQGLADMAAWLQERLEELGAEVEELPIPGAPTILLGHLGDGPRSVLVYDHYDVQPVDPIELWESPPFAPEVRAGRLYARGAADNKGDLVARLAGLHLHRELFGEPGVTLRFLIEGEEETGSRSIPGVVARYGERLRADGCIWEGHGIDHSGRPEFVFGAKGLAYVELTCKLLNDDQHSSLAVIAPSAAWHLVEALATLRGPDGRVLIDGFYDDVVPPSEDDLRMLGELSFDEETERARLGVESFVANASGQELLRRYFFEPTCNIAGLSAGFTVPGASKTVLPRQALAKLDLRLVPDQDPADVVAKLRKHLAERGFGDIEVTEFSMEHPVRSPSDTPLARAAIAAARAVFDQPPALAPMMIGTGPMYPIAGTLGVPTVSPAGVCRPDSNIHAPNENCRVEDFLSIVAFTVAWLRAYADS